MEVDLILLTRDRAPLLQEALTSILAALRQASFRARVLIGVSGADGPTFQVINSFKSQTSTPIVIHRFIDSLELGPSRQILIDSYSEQATWLCFLDDDIIVPSDYFQRLSVHFKRADVDVVGGPNLTPPGSSFFAVLSGAILGSWLGGGPFRDRYRLAPEGFTRHDRKLILCNLSVRKSVMMTHSFNPHIKGAEENELLMRALRSGAKAYYDPHLWVYHHRRKDLLSFLRQIRGYGEGRGSILSQGSQKGTHLLITFFFAVCIALCFLLPLTLLIMTVASVQLALQDRDARLLLSFFLFPLLWVAYFWGVTRGLSGRARGVSHP